MLPKRLLTVLLLIVCFFVGDRLLALLLEKVMLASHFRYSAVYRPGTDQAKDVLILGNSRGVNFLYAPDFQKTTGLTAHNLSYNGLSTRISEAVLLDYLDRKPAPRMVIIEISNLMMDDHAIDQFKLYTSCSKRLDAIYREEAADTYWASRLSRLFLFNCDMFLRTLYYLRRGDQSWINRRRVNLDLVKSLEEMEPADLRPALEPNLEALDRMVRHLREKGVTPVLVMAPYLPEYLARVTHLDSWLGMVRNRLKGKTDVLDYTSGVTDQACFADRTHMNIHGAAQLLQKLVADGIFRDLTASEGKSGN